MAINILILGAGQVGSTVAHSLAENKNEITVVDTDADALQRLQQELDIRTVVGHAASPGLLESAGAEQADLLLAVTGSDETNLLACQIAYSLFKTPTRIARVRSAEYLTRPELFGHGGIPVDVLISPERIITNYLQALIEAPEALQVIGLVGGVAQLLALRAEPDGLLAGRRVLEVAAQPPAQMGIAAVVRDSRSIEITGDTRIEAGDEVFFVAPGALMREVADQYRGAGPSPRKIIIAGGGNIGAGLASALESRLQVKVIEQDDQRAFELAERLNQSVVLHGEATDQALLKAESIDRTDVFCALTNNDDANVLAAMLAKHLGAKRTIAIVNRPGYLEMVEGHLVDVGVSPRQVTIGAILPRVRRGDVLEAHALRHAAAEVLVLRIDGTPKTSSIVGRCVGDLELPSSARIIALVRKNQFELATPTTELASQDLVIAVLSSQDQITDLEKQFQVSPQHI